MFPFAVESSEKKLSSCDSKANRALQLSPNKLREDRVNLSVGSCNATSNHLALSLVQGDQYSTRVNR